MMAVASQFVQAEGLKWYVEEMGQGPTTLLIHGTAASVHSWRDVMPLLAKHNHVVALDLPGHGQTRSRSSSNYQLDFMAQGVSGVLKAMSVKPSTVVGHSAGAAILAVACARQLMAPETFISFNGAFYPFGGVAGSLFSPIAKILAFNSFLPRALSGLASRATVEKLLRDTGSSISAAGVDQYFALFKEPTHVAAALGMMASWDLRGMDDNLVRLAQSCVFVAGGADKAVAPDVADRAAARCRNARTVHIKEKGHLLHEEHPALAADIIRGLII